MMNLQRAQINESVSRDAITSMWIARIVKRKDTITFNCTSALPHVKWPKKSMPTLENGVYLEQACCQVNLTSIVAFCLGISNSN